jgi:hypothetical protein
MLRSVLTINGQLQHVAISSTSYDQLSQSKVNYNTLQLVLIIKGQLQHVAISSEIERQLQHVMISSDN